MRILIPIILGILTGVLAARKNRNAIGWGIFGALFPLLALIILAFLSKLPKKEE